MTRIWEGRCGECDHLLFVVPREPVTLQIELQYMLEVAAVDAQVVQTNTRDRCERCGNEVTAKCVEWLERFATELAVRLPP